MEAVRAATGIRMSTLVMVGSLLSEGKVFVDRSHPRADRPLRVFWLAETFREDMGAHGVMMRGSMRPLCRVRDLDRGWVSVNLPDSHRISAWSGGA